MGIVCLEQWQSFTTWWQCTAWATKGATRSFRQFFLRGLHTSDDGIKSCLHLTTALLSWLARLLVKFCHFGYISDIDQSSSRHPGLASQLIIDKRRIQDDLVCVSLNFRIRWACFSAFDYSQHLGLFYKILWIAFPMFLHLLVIYCPFLVLLSWSIAGYLILAFCFRLSLSSTPV